MATSNSSSSGFSYAQAAKGRTSAPNSQPPSSKVTSETSTPATATFSELTSTGNWADDVGVTMGEKARSSIKPVEEPSKDTLNSNDDMPDSNAVEKQQINAAENVITNTIADLPITVEAKPITNGSSPESPGELEAKAQPPADPAWIAERKERQNATQSGEPSVKDDPKSKDSPAMTLPNKTTTLQEAPLPSVNPWMKRAEESKARIVGQPPTLPAAVPASIDVQSKSVVTNSKPKANGDANGQSQSTTPQPTSPETSSSPKMNSEVKKASFSKIATDGTALPSHKTSAPVTSRLVIKDETSWPTPDTVAENDRKAVPEKEKEGDKPMEEVTPTSTKPKKKEWTSMVVTPNIIFETQNIRGREGARGGDRGSRGATRGRGGGRGSAYAGERAGRSKETDNATQRSISSSNDTEGNASASRTNRNGSANATSDRTKEHRTDRSNHNDTRSNGKKGLASNMDIADISSNPVESRPTKSPKAAENPQSSTQGAPRAAVAANKDNADKAVGEADNLALRSTAPGTRKEPRPNEEGKDGYHHAANRGNKRNGRGRGGSREFTNGHQSSQTHVNGHALDLASTNSNFLPTTSPSAYQGGRGNHSFNQTQQGRGGWSRGNNTRTPSLPVDGYYQRFASYGPQSHLAPVQTYYPGMYDYQGYPLSVVPYQPYMDQQYLLDMVSTQLEYYFCTDNLIKDLFLRKNMDSQGFVFLKVIANFNRIKQLTTDLDTVRSCCINSENIEILVGDDGQERLRKKEGWEQFVLPVEHRNEAARSDGPQSLRQPDRPQLASWNTSPFRSSANARTPRGDRRSYDAGMAGLSGFAPPFAGFIPGQDTFEENTNGDNSRGRSVKSATFENGELTSAVPGISDEKGNEPDAFPDSQTPVLTVVLKMNQQRAPYHTNASRTFSNGSIDSRGIFNENERSLGSGTNGVAIEREANSNGNGLLSRGASPSQDRTNDDEISLFWMKDQNVPSEGLPTDVSLESYTSLRTKALNQRAHAATGTCPYDLDVLYQFWCHFLIRNFNSRMYSEFKHYANEDAKERHSFVGLQILVKFFAQSLLSSNTIRDRLLRDYLDFVNSEPAKLDGSAFKQLRSAWRNGALNLKNRKKLTEMVDTTLRERLEA